MNTLYLQETLTRLEQNHAQTLALLRTLCAIPAPSHHEEQRAAFIQKYLTDAGAQGTFIDDAKNVIWPINDAGTNPVYLFLAHTDTVFPDLSPMPFREEGDRYLCPGVGDDTANLSALLAVAQILARDARKPEGVCVVIAANSCEEGLGNLKGIRALTERYQGRLREVVAFDGTNDWLCTHPVGSERYEVTVTTAGGHSYSAFGNENAIARAAYLINELYQIRVPKQSDARTTYNVGTISGGTSVNTIAPEAHFTYEFRSTARECLREMRALFEATVEKVRSETVHIQVTALGIRPCAGDVDPVRQQALVQRVQKIAEQRWKMPITPCSGSTDCNLPLSLGIPAVCIGLYDGDGMHTREEWMKPDSLRIGAAVCAETILTHFS